MLRGYPKLRSRSSGRTPLRGIAYFSASLFMTLLDISFEGGQTLRAEPRPYFQPGESDTVQQRADDGQSEEHQSVVHVDGDVTDGTIYAFPNGRALYLLSENPLVFGG